MYASERHGGTYVDKTKFLSDIPRALKYADMVAQHFLGCRVEVVIGPALVGALFAQLVAVQLHLQTHADVSCVFAEKVSRGVVKPGSVCGYFLGRGFALAGKRVLVVEDVVTEGTAAGAVVELVQAAGGNVVGVGVLWNRGGVIKEYVGNPPDFFAAIDCTLLSWPANKCPLCAAFVPIDTTLGHGG